MAQTNNIGQCWLRWGNGWRALLVSFISGSVLALAFAPFNAWPLIFICLPVFFLLLKSASNVRVSTLRGFCFGYGFFMAGTWWIANALLVDADKFAWLMPFSILGLSAVIAWSFAVLGWLMFRLRSPHTLANILRFALLWVAMEYLRSAGMFGFPWNLLGYLSLNVMPYSQVASSIGIYGTGLLLVLLALFPLWLKQMPKLWAGFFFGLLLLWPLKTGVDRLALDVEFTTTRLRLVQPAIPQSLKANPAGRGEVLAALAQLSHNPTKEMISAIIWPETALPLTLWPVEEGFAPHFASLRMPAPLITGVVTGENGQNKLQLWNSVAMLSPQGDILARYNKHQLVPFGEFMPLRTVLPFEKVTPGDIDFSRGPGPQTTVSRVVPPFSALVCYEAIFPWIATDANARPAWLLNVTNDGWYGDSPGPYQHFAMTRMRAIEQGLPLVRAANNGISAIVDPYGRVREYLPLNARGVVDGWLPAALTPTTYSRMGEWPVWGFMLLLWGLSVCLSRRDKK
ncbi:MAG: apolipoprotein N-acyltransferase [Rickettsiales bacterium]